MTKISYKEILNQSKTCQNNVKKQYKTGMSSKWSYYFAKAIISPKKDITKLDIDDAKNPDATHISNQISRKHYLDICARLINYVERNKRLPNYVSYGNYKLTAHLLTEILSRVLVYYGDNGKLPNYVNANSKVFTKPYEPSNKVYKYFVKVFGDFGNTIDGALAKVVNKGYAYYYDDKYSNTESIDRIKKGLGVNCTDSCQVFYNIMLELIAMGKYKKVECLHVQCSSGGHVKLRITLNNGSTIIRDIACALSDNGKGYTCVWCTNSGTVNPSWFMENLNR